MNRGLGGVGGCTLSRETWWLHGGEQLDAVNHGALIVWGTLDLLLCFSSQHELHFEYQSGDQNIPKVFRFAPQNFEETQLLRSAPGPNGRRLLEPTSGADQSGSCRRQQQLPRNKEPNS